MELFTSRFKERIVSMVLDKEPQVATEAVRLLTLILQNMDGALTDADCERVFPLVYASSRPVAAAAGEFLYRKFLAPEVDTRAKSGDRQEGTRVFLQSLLAFFIEGEFHDHATYLVDSLWDCASALLKDWPVLTGLLLEECSIEGLGDLKESSLILILVASMRQATEGHPPLGRFSGKKVFSARERKVQSEERLRLTQHFIPLLPQLLAKFSADAEKVGPLLEALRYFDLTHYSSGRLEKYLDLLLSQLKEVVEKHTSSEVLELASQTLQLLCRTEFAFYSRVDFARSCIMDNLADKFQHEATELLQSSFSEKEEVYSMATTLRRIAFFHSAHDLTPWRFFEPCVRLLRHLLNTGEACEQVVIPAMTCAHFSLLWELSRCSAGTLPDQQQLLSLKDKVAAFCSLCQSCLVDVEPCVQEQAFVLLSDSLLIFGPQLTDGGHPALQELVYHPESALQSQLAGFLMDHVFNHSQAHNDDSESGELQVEQLHQRRNLLSGFCKLVVYGVLELSAASDVFKYYSKFYDDYGDIIKETLNQTRQIDRIEWAHTLLLSLQQLLTQLFLEEGPRATDSAAFLEIRDLARRFSLLFGLHQLQNRPALVALHKDGIKFAFEEPASPSRSLGLINLPFLELLSEFSPRLLPPDKALLLTYLEKTREAHFPGSRDEPRWPSLLLYRHSLSPQQGAEALQPRAASKRRHLSGSSEHSGGTSLTSGSRLQTPLLTSTALRAKRQLTGPPLEEESLGSEAEFAQRLCLIGEPEDSQEGEVS